MDEEIFENYCEWANDELIWGRGDGNWYRVYSLEYTLPNLDDDIEIPY